MSLAVLVLVGEHFLERISRNTRYHQASEDAADEVELNRVYEEMDPRHIMPSKYLAMEKMYRGTDEGLKALVQVCGMARSVAGANSPAGKARREAVKRVIEHYLQREGLESIIATLFFKATPDYGGYQICNWYVLENGRIQILN